MMEPRIVERIDFNNLSNSERSILAILSRANNPMTRKELSTATGLSLNRLSEILSRSKAITRNVSTTRAGRPIYLYFIPEVNNEVHFEKRINLPIDFEKSKEAEAIRIDSDEIFKLSEEELDKWLDNFDEEFDEDFGLGADDDWDIDTEDDEDVNPYRIKIAYCYEEDERCCVQIG